jgi:hypothetical protein
MNVDIHKIKFFIFNKVNILMLRFIVIALCSILFNQYARAYELEFSTYLGASDQDGVRDVFVDNQKNIYITGGTKSSSFPTTAGAYDRSFNGAMDIFVAKFNSSGKLLWSTFLGGPNYDRAYAIEVDNQGNVYVAGRSGPGFPTTAGTFQRNDCASFSPSICSAGDGWNGYYSSPAYGNQNAFVAKLSNDGTSLIWSSYVGAAQGCRDMALDSSGNVFVQLGYPNSTNSDPPFSWFSGSYLESPQGGEDDGIIKISSDGSSVIWATYIGGSADEGPASIRVDSNGTVYLGTVTASSGIATAGVWDETYNGGKDYYVAKVSSDGKTLLWATYLGGSGFEGVNTHTLAVDDSGNVYVAPATTSSDFPATSGAYDESYNGNTESAVVKLSSTGALIASTFLGGTAYDNIDGIYADSSGRVYVTGVTQSDNFPVTSDSYQANNGGSSDATLTVLSSDLSSLVYSTYMGGRNDDGGRTAFLDQNGNLYVAGSSSGSGWPTLNAHQGTFAGGSKDGILAKFNTNSLDTVPPSPPTGLRIKDMN